MANLQQQKSDVFGTISAFKTLLNDYPKFDISSLLPSINTSTNQLDFVVDLFSVLGSIDDLKNVISNIMIQYIDYVELAIKEILKVQIKENIACNINPSIMSDMKTCGVFIPLRTIDMFNLMRKSPLDPDAANFYFDVNPPSDNFINSNDFNVFLWYVVNQGCNGGCVWRPIPNPNQTPNLAVIDFIEHSSGTVCTGEIIEDNTINFKIYPDYAKKLTDFNSDFIDSVQLFDKQQLIAQVFGKVFGSLDASINRTQDEIFLEGQLNAIIDNLANCTVNETIDDSYFTFDNTTYNAMLREAELKKSGDFQYSKDENITVNITSQDILNALNGLNQTSDLVQQQDIFSNAIDSLINNALQSNPQASTADKFNFRVNIIKSLITELSSLLTMSIMTPKVYLLLIINLKLLGIDVDYDPISFIKNNINLVSNIVGGIKDVIMDKLMDTIVSMAGDLALQMGALAVKEQMKKYMSILQSLVPSIPVQVYSINV